MTAVFITTQACIAASHHVALRSILSGFSRRGDDGTAQRIPPYPTQSGANSGGKMRAARREWLVLAGPLRVAPFRRRRRSGQVIEHGIELRLRRLQLFPGARLPRLIVFALLALADEFGPLLAFAIAHEPLYTQDMRTIDTDSHGPLPVLDTWRECHNTKSGWTGVNDKGERVNITYRPEERAFGPARLPDKDYVVLMRGDAYGGVVEGVALIERASQHPRSRPVPLRAT